MPATAPPRPDLLRLSYDDYRALPAVANSDLSRLRDFLNGRGARSMGVSAALSFGTAFHTALLEPDAYVAGQKGINDTLVWWMVEAVRYDPDLLKMLETGVAEPSCLFTDPETGTVCKLRADLVIPADGNYTVVEFQEHDGQRLAPVRAAMLGFRLRPAGRVLPRRPARRPLPAGGRAEKSPRTAFFWSK